MTAGDIDPTGPGPPQHRVSVVTTTACTAVVLSIFAAIWLLGSTTVHGQSVDARREANVKAVFLYSFGRYVQWPDAPQKQFEIGILGETTEHFTKAISRIASTRTINKKLITIKRFESPEEVQGCQILFVTQSIPLADQEVICQKLATQPILLVGESPNFAAWGGVINFYLSGATVRFEINDAAAHHRSLKLDAKLLNLGRRVDTK